MLIKLGEGLFINDFSIIKILPCDCGGLMVETEDEGLGDLHIEKWDLEANYTKRFKADPGHFMIQFESTLQRPVLFWAFDMDGQMYPEGFGDFEFQDPGRPRAVLAPDGTVTEYQNTKVFHNWSEWEYSRRTWKEDYAKLVAEAEIAKAKAQLEHDKKNPPTEEKKEGEKSAEETAEHNHDRKIIPFGRRNKKEKEE